MHTICTKDNRLENNDESLSHLWDNNSHLWDNISVFRAPDEERKRVRLKSIKINHG